jgi:hypothetical protein
MFPSTGLPCVCELCGREYRYDHAKGHTKRVCNSCKTNREPARGRWKALLAELKAGGCELCGYNRCQRALTFHHLDPTTKRFHIAGNHTRKPDAIRAEVAKCVLVCENCHRELHDGLVSVPLDIRRRIERATADLPRRPRPRPGRPRFDGT